MFRANDVYTKIRKLELKGRSGDGDSLAIDCKSHFEMILTPKLVGAIPWVSKAVIELMKVSGDQPNEEGSDTLSLKVKRNFGHSTYVFDKGLSVRGGAVKTVEVKVVKGDAVLKWKDEFTLDASVLPSMASFVGVGTKISIDPDQQELIAA